MRCPLGVFAVTGCNQKLSAVFRTSSSPLVSPVEDRAFEMIRRKHKMKDHSKYISFGLYGGGVLGQKDFDIPKFFALLKPTKFTFLTTFLSDVWNNLGEYPWQYLPAVKTFDLQQWNEPWWAQLKTLFLEAAKADMGLHLCLFTDYQAQRWRKKIEFPKCPITDNAYGIRLADTDDSHELYSNWNRQDPSNIKNFAWLFWKADAKEECIMPLTKAANRMGAAVMAMIERFADTAKAARDESLAAGFTQRLYLRTANEALYRQFGKSLELDSRIQSWVRQTMLSRGFEPGANFRMVNEDESYVSGVDRDYKAVRKSQKWCDVHKFIYELHGCDAAEVQRLLAAGLDPDSLIPSMDGVDDESCPVEAVKLMKMLKAGKIKKLCVKCPDQFGPDGEWQRKNLNANMVSAVPKMAALVK
jgi:hypothetical protein